MSAVHFQSPRLDFVGRVGRSRPNMARPGRPDTLRVVRDSADPDDLPVESRLPGPVGTAYLSQSDMPHSNRRNFRWASAAARTSRPR
jgi:hypothetical protein